MIQIINSNLFQCGIKMMCVRNLMATFRVSLNCRLLAFSVICKRIGVKQLGTLVSFRTLA